MSDPERDPPDEGDDLADELFDGERDASPRDDTGADPSDEGPAPGPDEDAAPAPGGEPTAGDRDGPLSGPSDAAALGDPFAELGGEDPSEGPTEDPFEEVDDEAPIEDVWETLEDGEEGAALAPMDEESEPRVDVVDKRSFCQRCRYLTDPPTVRCTHAGTEILEVVDGDQFRVQNCPMVERGGPASDS
ncbi:MAG: hypothetical protein V5A46_04990 [Haloferacaceae archaeon]